jgi:DNA-binding MarR family transcriptional regulator
MANTDEFIGALIADVARLLRTAFDRRARDLGLTRPQWLALTRLYRRPGTSQSEFADMMEVEKATAGRMIDRLEAKGWVERRAQDGDRRVWRLHLTPEAERVHKRIWRIAESNLEDALADFSAQEGAQLHKLMSRVKQNLATMVEGGGAVRNGGARRASANGRRHNGRTNGRHHMRAAP